MPTIFAPKSVFDQPSLLHLLFRQPIRTLIRFLDLACSLVLFPRSLEVSESSDQLPIRVVCISDTHSLKCAVPDGDVLIHAGDLTNHGTPTELQDQINWLDSLPHKYKVAIAGNHDSWLDARCRPLLGAEGIGDVDWKGIKYLQHSSTTLRFTVQTDGGKALERKVEVFGAPQIPACGGEEFAFQYERDVEDAWSGTVPETTDILVTHTPPRFHLDLPSAKNGEGLGCRFLLEECWRVRPSLHVFGHVHAGRTETFGRMVDGKEMVSWDSRQKVLENALARNGKLGIFREMFGLRGMVDCMRVVSLGVSGMIWEKIWGGGAPLKTMMVNAALMYENTGKLGNEPQVVVI